MHALVVIAIAVSPYCIMVFASKQVAASELLLSISSELIWYHKRHCNCVLQQAAAVLKFSCVPVAGVTQPLQRIPHCIALWAAEASMALACPGSMHYTLVARAVLQKVRVRTDNSRFKKGISPNHGLL
jgi:hypothetical protein